MAKLKTELGVVSYRFEDGKIIVTCLGEDFMSLSPGRKVSKKEAEELIKEAVNEFVSQKE